MEEPGRAAGDTPLSGRLSRRARAGDRDAPWEERASLRRTTPAGVGEGPYLTAYAFVIEARDEPGDAQEFGIHIRTGAGP